MPASKVLAFRATRDRMAGVGPVVSGGSLLPGRWLLLSQVSSRAKPPDLPESCAQA